MQGWVWRAGSAAAAVAISLCGLTGAVAAERSVRLAQNAPDTGQAADAPALPANTPEQIKKAQIELRRLDCLKGRIDGKLGDQTRQAVKSFWTSAKQPAVEVVITDALIADLAAHGDNYCRPVRRFFGFGGRTGGAPFLAPGMRPIPAPTPAAPPAPAPAQ
jgi:peptidoglycan hydrolase-like protein with peptidoglycan-binding domain